MPDQSFTFKQTTTIGLMALFQELDLPVRRPTVRSWTKWSQKDYHHVSIVDMPDRRLFAGLILQNNGRLSQTKRATFPELKDEEISAIEAAVASFSQHAPSS